MALKGIERIDKILNDFLRDFDCSAEIDNDFTYHTDINLITYSFTCSEISNVMFSNVIAALCPNIKCDIFLWSLLHELGHHETIDTISDADYCYSFDEKQRIREQLSGVSAEKNEKLYMQIANDYYFLPDEIAATCWAVDFVTKNQHRVRQLWNELQPAIKDFYRLNEVELEG